MRALLIATVALALGGLLAPHFVFAGFGQQLDDDKSRQLDDVKKRMEPEPYKPLPHACERWKGKAFTARYDPAGLSEGCIAQCKVALVEASGRTGRWEITGERCAR